MYSQEAGDCDSEMSKEGGDFDSEINEDLTENYCVDL